MGKYWNLRTSHYLSPGGWGGGGAGDIGGYWWDHTVFRGSEGGISRRQHSTEGGGYVKLTANEGGIIGTLQSLGSSGNFFVTKPTSYKPPSPSLSPPPSLVKNNDRSLRLYISVITKTVFNSTGQFTLSTQLIILNYPVILSHRRSTTGSIKTFPFHSFDSSSSWLSSSYSSWYFLKL